MIFLDVLCAQFCQTRNLTILNSTIFFPKRIFFFQRVFYICLSLLFKMGKLQLRVLLMAK